MHHVLYIVVLCWLGHSVASSCEVTIDCDNNNNNSLFCISGECVTIDCGGGNVSRCPFTPIEGDGCSISECVNDTCLRRTCEERGLLCVENECHAKCTYNEDCFSYDSPNLFCDTTTGSCDSLACGTRCYSVIPFDDPENEGLCIGSECGSSNMCQHVSFECGDIENDDAGIFIIALVFVILICIVFIATCLLSNRRKISFLQ